MNNDRAAQMSVTTPFGKLVGTQEDGLHVFRGVRYALAPVGPRRFAPPAPLPHSTGEFSAQTDAAIPPQLPSRLEIAMGPSPASQSEDCLTLTIWSPANRGEKLPVLVWFHGGAFMSGGGSLPWYSGAPLARSERIVVVSVNSRLGALGYLRLAGVSNGNNGVLDQLASLRWVQQCIGAFGGDRDAVTVAGQSAGAFAVLALTVLPEGKRLFRRAILQSGPFAMAPTAEAGEERGAFFAKTLEIPQTRDAFERVETDKLLSAAGVVARQFSRHAGDSTPPFFPVVDGQIISGSLLQAAAEGKAAWCDMITGYTREECSIFSMVDPRFGSMTREGLVDLLRGEFPENAAAFVDEYEALRGYRSPGAIYADVTTDARFIAPTLRLADIQQKVGRAAYVYQFNWQSPVAELGANHCIELPFLLGERDAWANAPMFKGATDNDYRHISRTMRSYWGTFVRDGTPNRSTAPHWLPYDERHTVMNLGRLIAPGVDPAGTRWRNALSTIMSKLP